MKTRYRTAACLLLLALFAPSCAPAEGTRAQPSNSSWPEPLIADPAFYSIWSRADLPVATRAAARSWIWGPAPFAVANEEYAESPTGKRLVEYLDKARMEVNDPAADHDSRWYVTSGLLVTEMVTGRKQTGNSSFVQQSPAEVPVAGDAASTEAPTYASFARLTAPVPSAVGSAVRSVVARDGTVSPPGADLPSDSKLVAVSTFDSVTGHNVPAVFSDWMRQSATVLEEGFYQQGNLVDPLYVLGRPITEAYWTHTIVGGNSATVLVQLFERRALTYNPNNPPEWRVEMANVGRAYYDWRYETAPLAPSISSAATREGVRVGGWNWHPGSEIVLSVALAGAPSPLVEPQKVQADASGHFGLSLTAVPSIESALASGGTIIASASSGSDVAALPVGGSAEQGTVRIRGTVSTVRYSNGVTATLGIRTGSGEDWIAVLGPDVATSLSEGTPAAPGQLQAGESISISGRAQGTAINVSQVTIDSISRSGARIDFRATPGTPETIRLSGSGWPAGRKVSLGLTGAGQSTLQALATGSVDSRGNFAVASALPPAADLPAGHLWLTASAADSTGAPVRVSVPFGVPGVGTPLGVMPPEMLASSPGGEQEAGAGSFCWRGLCLDAIGTPLAALPLEVSPGETLQLRLQNGAGDGAGLLPRSFTTQLFRADDPGAVRREQIGNASYLVTSGSPANSTDDAPAAPLSYTVPPGMVAGAYALILTAKWPDSNGKDAHGVYGFSLSVR